MTERIGAHSLDEAEKLVLYSIGALGLAPMRSALKLQKLHFLLSRAFPDLDPLFEFDCHPMGPHSEVIATVLEDLVSLGLVRQSGSSYGLTDTGRSVFSELHPKRELAQVVEDFKDFLNDVPDRNILIFFFVFYPDFSVKSPKWEKLEARRSDAAISMLRKGKISFSKALEMSGMRGNAFIDLLKARKVRWRAI